MWCGSLRPVSVAPPGCQIAKGKVIYTADTVAVAVVVVMVGRETPRCLQEKQPVSPWQSYILYGWWQLGCKTFIGCRGRASQNAISLLHSLPSLQSRNLSTGLFSFSVQTKCIPVSLPTDVPAVRHSDAHT